MKEEKKGKSINERITYKDAFLVVFLFLINLFLPNFLSIFGLKLTTDMKLVIEIVMTIVIVMIFSNAFLYSREKTIKSIPKCITNILFYFFIAFAFNGLINFIIHPFVVAGVPNNLMLEEFKAASPVYFWISVLITSPIIESIVIFGAVRKINQNNKILGIFFSALLYGSFYVAFSYTQIPQLAYVVSYGAFAAVVAYAYCDTDNIYVPIGIKFIQGLLLLLSFI